MNSTSPLRGPRAPALLQFAEWIRRPIPYLEACQRRYGDTFMVRFPFYPPIALVSHPRAIRDVFASGDTVLHAGEANAVFAPVLGSASVLVVDGPTHHDTRGALTHGLGRNGERSEAIQSIVEAAARAHPTGRPLPLLGAMQSLTLDLLLDALIGIRPGPRAVRLRGELTTLLSIFDDGISMVTLWSCQRDLGPLTPWRKVRRRVATVRDLLTQEVGEARSRTIAPGTLLDRLATPVSGVPPLDDAAIVDQLMTLLISGHETLAPTLAWALCWLAARPELAASIRATASPTTACPHRSTPDLLDAFVKESMRLTPVIITVGRRLQRSMEIDGVTLPSGTVVAPCVYLTHRHRDVWEDPETFRPERFLERRPTAHEFYPFGGGVRHCLGADFAVTSLRTVVDDFARRFDRVVAEGSMAPTRRGTSIVPSPRVTITLTARND